MEEKPSRIINIFFFSSHPAGITSILKRMMYNKFDGNSTTSTEKKSYQYKILSGENFVIFNFHEQSIEILNDLDNKTENIIIYVYDLDKAKPFDSLNPIYEAIKSILGDKLKSIKIGIIGNKLDLISQNDKKTSKELGEKYAEKINAKFLMTSAKTGKWDVFQFILSLINSKSKIDIKNKKSILKEYQQLLKSKNWNGIIRCEKCKTKITKIIFHDKSEKIELCCNEHNDEKFIYTYKEIINLINKKCNICQKEFDEKSNDSTMYCKLCQNLICNKCIKRHEHGQNSNENYISYYYEEDLLCYNHGIKNDLYCVNCNSIICSFCYNNEHKEHKVKKFENSILDNLIREKRNQISKQKKQIENLKNYYTILINEITKLYNEFKDKMDLVLNLKENALNQLELIKYNKELFNTVVNMKFKEIKVDLDDNSNKSSILDKLTIFFDCIEQPIRIVKYNICNGAKVLKKYNLRQTENLTNNKGKSKLTDICNIDGNLCCIGFDDGNIYIYDKKDFKTCLKSHQLYDSNRGVNSIINYKNENLIFTSGYEKIYQLKINKNLYIQKEALITHPDTNFLKLCEYNYRKSIIYTDDTGNIGVYNIFDKQEFKINDDNENLEINSIIDFYNINENAFFMKYLSYELILKSERVSIAIPTNNRQNSEIYLEKYSIMDVTGSDASIDEKEKSRELSKIFYIDEQNKICNEHSFSETTKILGIINKEYILIEETDEKEQIKHKILNLITNKELYFGGILSGAKREWNFKLIGENPDDGKIYFVLVDYNFNMIEFSYDLQSNEIEEIGLLRRVNKDNPKDPKHKIVKIISMKRNFIIVKSNGELYLMNY